MKTSDQPRREPVASKDLFLIVIFTLVTMFLAVSFDAFDEFVRWYSAHEEPGVIEEVMVVILLLPVALGIFSYRRWREVVREIAERHRAEERQHKEVELRNLLLWLYEKAPRLPDKELYDYVLERAVQLTESTIGFFHLVSDDQKDIILTTWNSEAVKNCTASYATHYPIEQAGNWVDCVRFKRPIVYNDFPNSPNRRGLPEGHSPVRRFMSVPVLDEDKVRIIFGVGNKSGEYDENDVVQIQLVASCLQDIIKQRRSEVVLRESEAKYRTLFESATDGIFLLREGRFIDVNPSAMRMFACTREDLEGRFPYAFSTPLQPDGEDSRELAMERIEAVLSGTPQCFEWRHCRADGTRFDAEVTLNRVDLPEEVLVLGTVRDVSNRKRAEEELRQSRERLTLALESSRAGIWDRNVVENRSKWDDYHHLLFGLAPGSYSGNPNDFFSMIHPDDHERVRREMTAAINGDADYSTTYRVIWPDSSVHSLADRGKVHRDSTGRAVRMIGISWDISELKQAEEALKESQQQLENIINFLPDATLVIDKEGKVIAWNRAIEEMTGIRREEMLGKGNFEYALPFHGERRPILIDLVLQRHEGVEAKYDSIERKESVVSGEAYMPALRGGEVYLFGTASTLRDLQGNVVGAIESIRDITERKQVEEELDKYRSHLEELVEERTDTLAKVNEQLVCEIEERKKAEQALQESQQMLQLVLDTIPARVFWKNLDSTYLGCNRPFALDAGLPSPEEIIGKIDFEMGWTEHAEGYRADDRLVMETGRPKLGYEEPLTTPDGSRIWLRTNKVPLLDAGGKIRGVLGTYEDITESKRMEEALRASETRYRIVADNTYDWVYWLSPERRFLYSSPSCQKITGYTASEFETDPELLFHIVHADDLARFEAHLRQNEMSNAHPELEFRIIRKDGTTRWLGHVCQPVFDTHGFNLGSRGSNRDITDRKQVEQALQDSSQKLKHFAYSVSHDLKSPAVGVYGLTKRLAKHAKDVLDEKGRSYCDQILKASEHIAALVDKVNVYIATKEARLSFERINISEILQMLRDEFSAQLSIRQIEWLEPATRLEIKADRMCMLRAFRNFVDNSLKYGGERLTKISTGYEESEGFHIFSFSDDGKGLKEEGSEKIFEAFQRNETSRGVEGAGLGLTIVKEIAEQHGGKVWVEPISRKGVTFYISISKSL